MSYPTTVVVVNVWTELVPGHNKNPSGSKVGKFVSVELYIF